MSADKLKAEYESAGQGHVFTFHASLSPQEQNELVRQLQRTTNPKRVNEIFAAAIDAAEREKRQASTSALDIAPPAPNDVESTLRTGARTSQWSAQGFESIKQGHVGVLLMAGGQGTRLGSSAPKGCYDIGLPSHKSLFQIQAERIRRLKQVAKSDKPIPWYIMTSGPTRQATQDMFEKHDYFGIPRQDVIFFEQGLSFQSARQAVSNETDCDRQEFCLVSRRTARFFLTRRAR